MPAQPCVLAYSAQSRPRSAAPSLPFTLRSTCSALALALPDCSSASPRRGLDAPHAAEGDQLVVSAVAAPQAQEAVGQDAALEEHVELARP